jgi:NDP-sugar pyrophosphorylase family protein
MRAVLLVGGEGTRLRPLTYETPKQLLPVAGKTLLERVLAPFLAFGLDELVLSLGYLPDRFRSAFPDGVVGATKLRYVTEPEPLGTAGALRFALDETGWGAERFWVRNGDVVADIDLARLVACHERTGALATLSLTEVADPSSFGVVDCDEAGHVRAFVEKPPLASAPSRMVNAGTYLLEPAALADVVPARMVSVERETFPALVAAGRLAAVADRAEWIDAGTPPTYLATVVAHLRAGVPGREGATSLGRPDGAWGDGVGSDAVGSHAAGSHAAGGDGAGGDGAGSDGPAWGLGDVAAAGAHLRFVLLGPESVVAAGAVLEDSTTGSGVEVGAGAVVRRSVLLDGAVVEPGATVEDSVVGWGARVGRDATLRSGSVLGRGQAVPAHETLVAARLPA